MLTALVCIAMLAGAFEIVHGEDAASIWTSYDTDSTHHRTAFLPGQIVYIFWFPTGSSQNVRITDENNNLLTDFGTVNTQPLQWQIPTDAKIGDIYWIIIPGTSASPYPISVATVQVVPEVSWSPLAAAILGLVVFAAFAKRKQKEQGENC